MENPNSEHHSDHPGIPEDIRQPDAPIERLHQISESGQKYARENLTVVGLGILAIGIIIGLSCGSRTPKRKTTSATARALAEDIMSKISDRLPKLKKEDCCPSSILKHCQEAGKNLKWW